VNPFAADYRVLSTMIAPALLMTATGSLILSSNNRLARIVDRIRVLIGLLDQLTLPSSALDFPDLRKKYHLDEVAHLHRRSGRIRTATALLYLAFAMFVGSSLVIGVDLFLTVGASKVPTILALLGVGSLLWASINLFEEARTAVRSVDLEIDFLRSLHAERERQITPNPQTPANV
jgi:hypothetical protein